MQKLPTFTQYQSFSFTVELESSEYKFSFRWVERSESWYFDLLTPQDVLIVGGVRVVLGTPLLQRYKDDALPPGDLIVLDTTGSLSCVGRYDLGVSALVVYLKESEIPGIELFSEHTIEFSP